MSQPLHITAAEYHARPEWSCSQVKKLPGEPELFNQYYVEKSEIEPAAAKAAELGHSLHSVVLEGESIPLIPIDVLNAQGHRKGAAWKEYEASHPGPLLTAAEARPLMKMIEAVQNTPQAATLLQEDVALETEVSFVQRHEATGLPLRCRVDRIVENSAGLVVCDLKTFRGNPHSRRAFGREMYNRGYHRQVAWYVRAVEEAMGPVLCWCWVVVQNEPPYSCKVWEIDPQAMELGHDENEEALAELAKRLETYNWRPANHDRVGVVNVPQYAYAARAAMTALVNLEEEYDVD